MVSDHLDEAFRTVESMQGGRADGHYWQDHGIVEFEAIQHQMAEEILGLLEHNHDEDDYHDHVIHFHDHVNLPYLGCDSDLDLHIHYNCKRTDSYFDISEIISLNFKLPSDSNIHKTFIKLCSVVNLPPARKLGAVRKFDPNISISKSETDIENTQNFFSIFNI